jgi:hypothetical protein
MEFILSSVKKENISFKEEIQDEVFSLPILEQLFILPSEILFQT